MTKKKTRSRFRLIDLLVVIICTFVCGLSIYLFFNDLNRASVRTDKDSIGSITFKYKIAQRKFNDRVVWERVQQNSSLYNLDTIRTTDLAEAYITFLDGTELNLGENTMLQISYDPESGVALNVNGGNLVVDTSKSDGQVRLKMENGTSVNLESGSRLSASVLEGNEAAVQLQSGSGTVKGNKGAGEENVLLSAGESATIGNNGGIKKGSITVTSISSDLKVLSFEDTKEVPVHLEWNASDALEGSEVIIQTSRTKDFSVIDKTYTSNGSSSVDVNAPEGTLYWRVFPKEAEDESVEGKVRVVDVAKITTATPNDNATFSYRDQAPVIQFGWNGNSYADHYKIEIATKPDFNKENIVVDEDVSTERVSFSEFEKGEYYWRVTPYYVVNQLGYAEATEIKEFNVIKKEAVEPPVLTAPGDNSKIVYTGNLAEANFMWKSEVKDAEYELLVSRDENFDDVIYSEKTTIPRFKASFDNSLFGEGEYFWKVLRNSQEDKEPAPSKVRKFKLSKYVPGFNRLIFPPDNYAVEDSKISTVAFTWKLADEYENKGDRPLKKDEQNKGDRPLLPETLFQISSSIDFSSGVREIRQENKTEVKNIQLGSGTYYWRIGVLDSTAGKYNFTEERIITVLKGLENPHIISPVQGSVLIGENSLPVNLVWQNVNGADYYKVQAIDEETGELVQEFNDVRNNNLRVVLNLNKNYTKAADGKRNIMFAVQPYADATEYSGIRSGKASTVSFAVRNAQKLKLLSPDQNQLFEGLYALRSPIIVNWESGEDVPSSSQFILRKIQANGTSRIVQTIDNPEKSINLERLSSGTYQWTVKASTSEGIPVGEDEFRTFTVGSVPDLPRVTLSSPENNFVMDSAYLRRNRNITFRWNGVPGATDYTFVLYLKTADGTLKRITGTNTGKQTSFKLKDLSVLDIGSFEWQVTAYCHAKDGFEEQHSKAATGQFEINIKKPGKVKIEDPGELYGE